MPFGRCGGAREAGGTVAESLVGRNTTRKRTVAHAIGRGSTRFGEDKGQLDRRRVRGVLNPCARESKTRTGRFLRGKLISGHGLYSFYESQQGTANQQDCCASFLGMRRALDGWILTTYRIGNRAYYWVGMIEARLVNVKNTHTTTRFGEGEGQFDRRRSREGLNPCARESKARTGRFLKEKLVSDHGQFSSYESHRERRTGKILGTFSGMHRALDGWMLARAPASPAQGLHHHGPCLGISIFRIFVRRVALRNLDLLIKTGSSVICPIC